MNINIVSGVSVISKIKKSKYYKSDLGFSATVTDLKTGDRVFSSKDAFLHHYNTKYRTTANKVGSVGNINFYIDYYIRDESIATYCDDVEYVMKFDNAKNNLDGIDSYLGFMIRNIIDNEQSVKDNKSDEIATDDATKKAPIQQGNADILSTSPGSVSYEDVLKYMQQKNNNRL